MCFKKKDPRYHWFLILTTDNQMPEDEVYYFTKEQTQLIDQDYNATVKMMSKFCFDRLRDVPGLIKLEARTKHWYRNTPKIKISVEKRSESELELRMIEE
jgi:hypothetical protein